MIEFELPMNAVQALSATNIAVVGVGGAGGNIINDLMNYARGSYQCIAINTDVQALEISRVSQAIHIGTEITKGRGAGADPQVGKSAAEHDIEKILSTIGDAELVFLTGGLGGGTGSGALPVIAQALKERDILTVCIVTKPFSFEGKRRMLVADQAESTLRSLVDTLVVIPNEKLMHITHDQPLSFLDAFSIVSKLVGDYIRSIVDIITKPGHINVDFADVKTVMKHMGSALMGTARATGPERALNAADAAINSPFLDTLSMRGARNILINISGNSSLGLHEIQQAAHRITEDADQHATIIIGSVIDESLGDSISITVLATGFTAAPTKNSTDTTIPQRPYNSIATEQISDSHHTVAKQHPLRDLLTRDSIIRDISNREVLGAREPSAKELSSELEKRLREQYGVGQDTLEVPALLRKLLKEQTETQK